MPRAGWEVPQGYRAGVATLVIAILAFQSPVLAQKPAQKPAAKPAAAAPAAAPVATLKRIKDSGRIRLGYVADARPYSFKDGSGNPTGFAVDLCSTVADAIKGELGLSALAIDWVTVAAADQYKSVQQGDVDLLCGSARPTLANRTQAAFSIAIFPGGIGVLVRQDAPPRLKDVLLQRKSAQPNWRGNAVQLLSTQRFSVVKGSPAETWATGKIQEFQLSSTLVHVDNYDAGFKEMVHRQVDAFFGDRAVLLDALQHNLAAKDLQPIDRLFTFEPVALGMGLGNEDLRLIVDRTLSKLYTSGGIKTVYSKYFGPPDETTLLFYRWAALPD
jgi:putrescine:ornithine antiporter